MTEIIDILKTDKKLNDNDQIIVKYIIDHIDEITHLSSRELARRTYTSSTTVIRLTKKLGYETYNDFKLNISSYLKNMGCKEKQIMSNENMLSLVNKISDIEVSIIEQTKDLLSMTTLNEVISQLSKAKYIDIVANDANANIAEYASHLFFSLGKFVSVYSESDKQLRIGMGVPKDHYVIVISKYGNNEHIIHTAQLLKQRGIDTLALTTKTDKRIYKLCNHVIYGLVHSTTAELKDIIFYISLKYIFDLFYVILFSQNYENTLQLDKAYGELFNKKL